MSSRWNSSRAPRARRARTIDRRAAALDGGRGTGGVSVGAPRDATVRDGNRNCRRDARVRGGGVFDGIVAFDEDARLTVTGGWLGADGAFGAASMRRVGSSSESFGAPSAEKATRARNGRAAARASLRTPSGARARWRAAARARRGRTGSSRRFAPEAARASSWKTAKTTSSPRTRTARRRRIRRTFRLATENILRLYLFRLSSVISYVAGVYSLDYGNAWTAFAAMRANIASAKPGARAASRSSASCSKTITEHPRVSCANASRRRVASCDAARAFLFFRLRRRLARRRRQRRPPPSRTRPPRRARTSRSTRARPRNARARKRVCRARKRRDHR